MKEENISNLRQYINESNGLITNAEIKFFLGLIDADKFMDELTKEKKETNKIIKKINETLNFN